MSCVSLPSSQLCKSQCETEIGCRAFDYTLSTVQCFMKQLAWGKNGFNDPLLNTPGTDHYSQHCRFGNIQHINFMQPQWLMSFGIVSRYILMCILHRECTYLPWILMLIFHQNQTRQFHVIHTFHCIAYIITVKYWYVCMCECEAPCIITFSSSKLVDVSATQWCLFLFAYILIKLMGIQLPYPILFCFYHLVNSLLNQMLCICISYMCALKTLLKYLDWPYLQWLHSRYRLISEEET